MLYTRISRIKSGKKIDCIGMWISVESTEKNRIGKIKWEGKVGIVLRVHKVLRLLELWKDVVKKPQEEMRQRELGKQAGTRGNL